MPVSAAASMISRRVSVNMDVRMPAFWNSFTISVRNSLFLIVSQPALDVRASGGSGTSVTDAL